MIIKSLKFKENITPFQKTVRYVCTAIITIAFLLSLAAASYVAVQVIGGKKPSLLSYRFYYILTDSMEPSLQVNDLIVSQVVDDFEDAKKLREGDVITYEVAYGQLVGFTLTHRVIEPLHYDEALGRFVVTTQGTRPGAIIDPPVPYENIEGVMLKKAVGIGKLYQFCKSPWGIILLIGVPSIEILGTLIWKLIKENKRKPKPRELNDDEKKRKAELEKELAEKAVADYIKTSNAPSQQSKEQIEKAIAEQAVADFIRSQKK